MFVLMTEVVESSTASFIFKFFSVQLTGLCPVMDVCPYRTKLYTNTKYETDSKIKQESVLALCVLIHFGISSGLAKGECRCWRYVYIGRIKILDSF